MDKSTPVRKPHTSTADLLTWSVNSPESYPPAVCASRSHQPSDGISKVVFGGQVSDEDVSSLNQRKTCSNYKMKEMNGSGLFEAEGEIGVSETEDKTGVRMYEQALTGMSHVSFGGEELVSPKRLISLPEATKLREMSGHLQSNFEAKLTKQVSLAKNKELSGNYIFAPPPKIQPRPLAARALALRESITIGEPMPNNDVGGNNDGALSEKPVIKTAKKIPSQKFSELSGNGIFKGDEVPSSADKSLSSAKLREMSGNNIFADGKAESREFLDGGHQPPGGDSSIALV